MLLLLGSSVSSTQSHRAVEHLSPPFQFHSPPNPLAPPPSMSSNYQGDIQSRSSMIQSSPAQAIHYPNNYVPMPHHATELDAHYWKNMFIQLGFGESAADLSMANYSTAPLTHPMEQSQQPNQRVYTSHLHHTVQGSHYQPLHPATSQESYGH